MVYFIFFIMTLNHTYVPPICVPYTGSLWAHIDAASKSAI